ncbi:hypothetical protein D3C72_1897050 [compost metagenome]
MHLLVLALQVLLRINRREFQRFLGIKQDDGKIIGLKMNIKPRKSLIYRDMRVPLSLEHPVQHIGAQHMALLQQLPGNLLSLR